MKIDINDPRLTAYVLGELEPAEAAEAEAPKGKAKAKAAAT